jgi:hypothetical protein
MKTAGSVFMILLLFFLIGCSEDSDMDRYHKLIKKELAGNKKVDSIFFGTYFGMTQKNFFMHCWEMNKKGILTDGNDGTGKMTVLYKLDKELKYPASMNFYPDFNDSTIWRMRALFHYDGWGPWNKHMAADSLLPDVVSLYKRWYSEGNPFITVNDKTKGTLYIKVDGNRKIVIGKYDDVLVKAEFTDMLIEKLRDKK